MADRTFIVRIGANVTDLVSKIRTAEQATRQWADKTQTSILNNRANLDTLSTGLGAVGAGMVAAAGLAVKSFADFDAAMSSVQAATMESSANMDLLRQAAMDAGAETVYSATEAAGAIEELAKAGVSTEDILSGGLSGALDLAAAGQIEVADAAAIASAAMVQFGKSGEDVTHIADLLAAGAGKALGGVSELGQALNQSGLVASQMGLSIEETIGSLAAFAEAGLLGSDAGTSFRAMLLRLANPTKESAELMAQLGINAYDAQGNFIGMEGLAAELTDALGGLTQEQRNAALAQIFGQDAIRTSTILYENGAEGIRDWTDAVNDQGYAAEVAGIQLDNLKGDIEALRGALDTALIGMGEGADTPLRSFVQSVTEAINRFNELPPAAQNATMAIVGGGGLVLLGVAGLTKLTIQLAETRAAVQALRASSLAAAGAGVFGAGANLAVAALDKIGISVDRNTTKLDKLAGAVGILSIAALGNELVSMGARAGVASVDIDALASSLERATTTADVAGTEIASLFSNQNALTFLPWVNDVESLDDALAEFGGTAREALGQDFWDQVDRFGSISDMDAFEKQVSQLDAALAQLASSGSVEQATQLYEQFTAAAVEQGVELEALAGFFPAYAAALEGQQEAATGAGESVDVLTQYQNDQAAATEAATAALEDWLAMVSESDAAFIDLLGGYQSIIDRNREVAEATAAATASSEDSWEDYYDGFSVGMEEYLAELEGMVAAQEAWETNMLILSGRVSQGVLDELASLGPEGAPLVADLVNASDEELARLEEVYGQRSDEATGAFADNLRQAGPVLAAIMGQHGQEAADAAAAELASGEKTLQDVIDQYDLDFVVDADTGVAESTIDAFVQRNNDRRVTIWVDSKTGAQTGFRTGPNAMPGMAAGGAVLGAGTGTSDSILARLSNGEHVWTAREVAAAGGQGAVSALRQMALAGKFAAATPGYALGGPVMVQAAAPTVVVQPASPGFTGPLVHVDRVVEGTPADVGREVRWAMLGGF